MSTVIHKSVKINISAINMIYKILYHSKLKCVYLVIHVEVDCDGTVLKYHSWGLLVE